MKTHHTAKFEKLIFDKFRELTQLNRQYLDHLTFNYPFNHDQLKEELGRLAKDYESYCYALNNAIPTCHIGQPSLNPPCAKPNTHLDSIADRWLQARQEDKLRALEIYRPADYREITEDSSIIVEHKDDVLAKWENQHLNSRLDILSILTESPYDYYKSKMTIQHVLVDMITTGILKERAAGSLTDMILQVSAYPICFTLYLADHALKLNIAKNTLIQHFGYKETLALTTINYISKIFDTWLKDEDVNLHIDHPLTQGEFIEMVANQELNVDTMMQVYLTALVASLSHLQFNGINFALRALPRNNLFINVEKNYRKEEKDEQAEALQSQEFEQAFGIRIVPNFTAIRPICDDMNKTE